MTRKILLLLYCLSACARDLSRDRIYKILISEKVLNPDRELVHVSESCALRLAGRSYPVVDIQEIVKGAATPRGVNRIVVLDPASHPVKIIAYTSQRPLFCLDNKLFVYGDLTIDNVGPEGNVLTFLRGGQDVTLTHIEANNYPVPVTRERKTSLQ